MQYTPLSFRIRVYCTHINIWPSPLHKITHELNLLWWKSVWEYHSLRCADVDLFDFSHSNSVRHISSYWRSHLHALHILFSEYWYQRHTLVNSLYLFSFIVSVQINGIALDNKSVTECEALLRSCRDSISLSLMKVGQFSSLFLSFFFHWNLTSLTSSVCPK